jgi:hypothetical protein
MTKSGVKVGRINGFVLAAQDVGYSDGQSAENRAIGINYMPLALVQVHFRQMRFHFKIQSKGTRNLTNRPAKSTRDLIKISGW